MLQFRVAGFEDGLGLRGGLGFRVQGSGFSISRSRVQGLGFRGLGFRVQHLGFNI